MIILTDNFVLELENQPEDIDTANFVDFLEKGTVI